jgi:hypothetical protein
MPSGNNTTTEQDKNLNLFVNLSSCILQEIGSLQGREATRKAVTAQYLGNT